MRKLLLGGAMALVMLHPDEPARAQAEGPWCLKYNTGRAVGERCSFRTFEACRDARTLEGSTAFCSQNPSYLPYWQGRGFGEEPRRQVARKTKPRRY
jgi:hypothetical protein